MDALQRKEIIKLMKTGNFTICYYNHQEGGVWKGHLEPDELDIDAELIEFSNKGDERYLPEIVDMLVEALGGECNST